MATEPLPPTNALLCERCGYVIDGLEEDGACPECGSAIRESLPARRVGSDWQRSGGGLRAGMRAWGRTFAAMVTRPRQVMAEMQVQRRGNRRLLLINILAAAALMSLCWAKQLHAVDIQFGVWWLRGYHLLAVVTVIVVFLWPMMAAGLAVMVWIESRGIRFFGNRRGWRVTRDVAWTVCAHASYWWVLGAGIALAVMLALPTNWEEWLPNRVRGWSIGAVDWVWIAPAVVTVFVVGLLGFETLVYIGVRRCRFANAARGE